MHVLVVLQQHRRSLLVHPPGLNPLKKTEEVLLVSRDREGTALVVHPVRLILDEHVVEVQAGRGGALRAAGPTWSSWSWVRQEAEAGSLVLQSLSLTLQDQVQQGLRLLLLLSPGRGGSGPGAQTVTPRPAGSPEGDRAGGGGLQVAIMKDRRRAFGRGLPYSTILMRGVSEGT